MKYYPLKFEPVFKSILWGGRNLEKLGKTLPPGKIAESWEISAHPDGMGRVSNGIFRGMTLEKLADTHREEILGSSRTAGSPGKFPLLIKLIDANDKLSVQVHPDDTYAKVHENGEFGKNELWYVVDCLPEAKLVYGLKSGMTRERFRRAVEDNHVRDCLNVVSVKPGDCLDIPAGLVHAIGEGILICEVQQNSNTTYRVYDYDRITDGKKRELHLEKAMDVIDYSLPKRQGFLKGLAIRREDSLRTFYKANRYFCVEHVACTGLHADDTRGVMFHAYTFLEGKGRIGSTSIFMGDSVLLPAAMGQYTIEGRFSAIKSYVPDLDMDVLFPLLEEGYAEEEIRREVL